MAKDWWFKFEFNKWRNSSELRRCSLETKGFWLECICVMREMGTDRLTGSYAEISRMVGCFPEEAARCIVELKRTETARVTLGNGDVTLVSRYISKELKVKKQTRLRVAKLRGNADVTHSVTDRVRSKSNKKEEEKKEETHKAASRPKKGTRIPEPFFLTKEMREYGHAKRPNLDLEEETEKFVNYFRSKAGRDATKLDWLATWQNWILNARGTNGNGKNYKSTAERSGDRAVNAIRLANAVTDGDAETIASILGCDDNSGSKGYLSS